MTFGKQLLLTVSLCNSSASSSKHKTGCIDKHYHLQGKRGRTHDKWQLSAVTGSSSPRTLRPYRYFQPFTCNTSSHKRPADFRTPQQEGSAYSRCSQGSRWRRDPASIFYPPPIHRNSREKSWQNPTLPITAETLLMSNIFVYYLWK